MIAVASPKNFRYIKGKAALDVLFPDKSEFTGCISTASAINIRVPTKTVIISPATNESSTSQDKISIDSATNKSSTSRDKVASVEPKADTCQPRVISCPHGPIERVTCGCIPNIRSLFEMAELRRQYRERLKNEEMQKCGGCYV